MPFSLCPWLLLGLNIIRKEKKEQPWIPQKRPLSTQIPYKVWSFRKMAASKASMQGCPRISGTPREDAEMTAGSSATLSYQGLPSVYPVENVEKGSTKGTFLLPPSDQNNQIINKIIIFQTRLSLISKWGTTIITLRLFPTFPLLTCPPTFFHPHLCGPVLALQVKIPMLFTK